jgi:hypothetical protein
LKIEISDDERKKIKRLEQIKKNSYTVKRIEENTYEVISKSNPDDFHIVYKDNRDRWHCDKCKGFIYRLTCTHIEQAKIVNKIEKNFNC